MIQKHYSTDAWRRTTWSKKDKDVGHVFYSDWSKYSVNSHYFWLQNSNALISKFFKVRRRGKGGWPISKLFFRAESSLEKTTLLAPPDARLLWLTVINFWDVCDFSTFLEKATCFSATLFDQKGTFILYCYFHQITFGVIFPGLKIMGNEQMSGMIRQEKANSWFPQYEV